jgi:cytochrome c-type biogenesis protein CcmH/NrfG
MKTRTMTVLLSVSMLFASAAWSADAKTLSAGKVSAAVLKRDTLRCSRQADIDACYDALRWQPSDPALLVGLGDALLHANRPADALRNYRRAAELAPATRGLTAKITATEAKLHAKRAAPNPVADHAGALAAKHYSNAAPVAQSH